MGHEPSKYQKAIYQEFKGTKNNILVNAVAGCLAKGTGVLMFDGTIKNVEDVGVNDLLMGPDSLPRKVLRLCRGESKMHEIIPVKGDSFVCNEDHILTLHSYRRKRKGVSFANQLEDISVKSLIESNEKTHPNGNFRNYKLQRFGVEFSNNETLPVDPYLVGLWLGDGFKQKGSPTFSINDNDTEIINFLYSINAKKLRVESGSSVYSLAGDGGKLRSEFRKFGDSNSLHIEHNYLTASREDRLKLLAGILDTDGHFSKHFEITVKQNRFANDIAYLCRSLGFAAYVSERECTIKRLGFKGTYWRVNISGELSEIPTLLPRKQSPKRKQIKSTLRTGFKIKPLGYDSYYGFQVDGDNRYLLGDFTVTHNSGKTTTLIELMGMTYGEITFLAFNKSIVNELKEKVPSNVNVMTMHSLGIKSVMRKHGKVDINASKTNKWIKKNIEEDVWEVSKKEAAQLYLVLPRLYDIYRLTLCESKEQLLEQALKIGVEFKMNHLDMVMDLVGQLSKYNRSPKEVDFTDMIYLPATDRSYTLNRSDLWCIDEIQDLSPCQQLLFNRARGRSRFIGVGDPKQSIYLFAGADSDGFNKFAKIPNTTVMPLSVCYRCPTRVVSHANKVHDIMESPEWMKVGRAYKGEVTDAQEGDMVICRNVKPLVSVFFKLIAQEKRCYIKGKDIGESLIRVVKPYKDKTLEQMFDAFAENLQELEGELIEQGIMKPRNHPRYGNLQEKHDVCRIISATYNTPQKMLIALENMFGDEDSVGICLSSIHKSKGLEANNVYFLDQHLIPSKYATTEEQIIQEMNLKYVAITRAQDELIYCFSQ